MDADLGKKIRWMLERVKDSLSPEQVLSAVGVGAPYLSS